MKKKAKTTVTKNVQKRLESLATKMIIKSGKFRKYTERDLFNATFIFIEVALSRFLNLRGKVLSLAAMSVIVEEFGSAIRRLIKLFTGDDMHRVARKIAKSKKDESNL